MLVKDTGRGPCPENQGGCVFIIRGEVGRERRLPSASSFFKDIVGKCSRRMLMAQVSGEFLGQAATGGSLASCRKEQEQAYSKVKAVICSPLLSLKRPEWP